MPTRHGLVTGVTPGFPDWVDDETRKPESMAEEWLASEGDGYVLGTIWQRASAQEISSWTRPDLTLAATTLPAFGCAEAPDIYVYAGPGPWRDVRAAWRRLGKPTAPAGNPRPRAALEASIGQAPLVMLGNSAETAVHLDNVRNRELSGMVEVNAPAGWTVSPAKGEFKGLKRTQPVDVPVSVRRKRGAGAGAGEGSFHVRHALADAQFLAPMIALGRRGGVELSEYQDQGRRLVSIATSAMRVVVAPDYVGSVVAIEHNGANNVFSSFPTPRPLSWINPWYGGISGVVLAPDDDDAGPGSIGRMHLETWSYELVHARRGAAIPWTGVRVRSDLNRDRLRGLRLEMDYLTIGQSNVLAVATRLVNLTDGPYSAILITQGYVQPGGERDKGVLYDLGGRRVRRMSDFLWNAGSGKWGGVAHELSGRCVAVAGGAGVREIDALDFGMDGAHLFAVSQAALAPRGVYEMTSYLVLAPDVAHARLYRWLEQWTSPR